MLMENKQMVMLNINSFLSEIPLPSFSTAVGTLVTSVQEKALEILQSGTESFYDVNDTCKPYFKLAAAAGIVILSIRLFKDLTKKPKPKPVREPMRHIISLPEAADQIFSGHRCDKTHPFNLFATELNSDRVLECETKEETRKLRGFFTSHLKKQIALNNDFSESTEKWALQISKKSLFQSFDTRIFISSRYRQLCETQKFIMKLCWNLFIGSGDPPKGFGSVTRNPGTYSYTLSEIDILRDSMYEAGLTDDTMVLNMVNDFEVGCGIFASMISKALSVLCEDSKLQNQVFQELADLKNEGKDKVEIAKGSPLLVKIIGESLRTFEGISPLGRSNARRKFVIKNPSRSKKKIVVKPGDRVAVDYGIMKNDPKIVGPDPEKFNINRPYMDKVRNIQAMAWRPFAKGHHSCPAATAVQTLSELIITTLILEFKISIVDYKINVIRR